MGHDDGSSVDDFIISVLLSFFGRENANDEWEERMDQMTRQELRTILNVRFDMCRLYIYISIHKSACGGDFLSQQYSCCMQQAVI